MRLNKLTHHLVLRDPLRGSPNGHPNPENCVCARVNICKYTSVHQKCIAKFFTNISVLTTLKFTLYWSLNRHIQF